MKCRFLFVVLFLGLVHGSSHAQVAQFFVATTGNDSNSGTQASPWKTITHAAAALTPGAFGTQVNVAQGTYNECVATNRTGTPTARIRYISTVTGGAKIVCNASSNPAGTPTVWANGTGSNTRTADYVDIVGFEITANPAGNRCEGISQFGAFGLIQGNYVHDILGQNATTCNTQGGGGIVLRNNGNPATVAHDSVVNANIIDKIGTGDDGVVGDTCATIHGVYVASPRQTVTNNTISRACGWGIHQFHDTCQNVISNNNVIHNYRGGILTSAGDSTGSPSTCAPSGGQFVNDHTYVGNNNVANNGGGEYGISEKWGPTGSSNVYRNNQLFGNAPTTGCVNPPAGVTGCQYNFSNGPRTVSGTLQNGTNSNVWVNYTGDALGNYHLKPSPLSPSAGTGATGACAPGGLSPCTPSLDASGATMSSPPPIGSYTLVSGGNPTFTPQSFTYPNQIILTTSSAQTFTFTNSSGSALAITSIVLSDTTNYVLGSSDCPVSPATIANNASCHVPASFRPQTTGAKSANITITFTGGSGIPIAVALLGTGINAPPPTLTPSSQGFGNVIIQTQSNPPLVFTFNNNSGISLTITGITLSDTTNFALVNPTCQIGVPVPNGNTCSIPVAAKPQSLGAKSGTVSVAYSGTTGSPLSGALSVTGVAAPPPPPPTFLPATVNFGSQVVFTTTPNPAQVFTFTNTTGSPLLISGIAKSGSNPADWILGTDDCPRSPATLAVGAPCHVPAQFNPQTTGSKPESIAVTYTGTGSPLSVSLAGVGLAAPPPPNPTLTPTTLNYGDVITGTTTAPAQPFLLTNSTGSPLAITGINVGDTTNYLLGSDNCPRSPATLANTSSCTIPLSARPQTLGSHASSLTVTYTGGLGTISSTLAVNGVPPPPPTVTITPTSHSFGSVTAGTQSGEFTFTVSNGIGSTLNIGQLGKIGANPGSFTLLNDNCSNQAIGSQGQCTFGTKCSPPTSQPGGSIGASISFPDNAAGSPHSAPMTCTALAPALVISPSPVLFGSVLVGSQSDIVVTVTNNGTANATFNSVAMLAGTNFILLSNGCTSLAPTAHCNFTVRFKPLSVGPLSDSVTISDNASNSPQNLVVSGTGGGTNPAFSPAALSYGQLATGLTAYAPATFHSGSSAINISSVTTPANFGQINTCGGLVQAFSPCNFQVAFSPTAVTSYGGNLSVFFDDALLADLNLESSSSNWSTCVKPGCDPGGVGPPTSVNQTFGASSVVSVAGPAFTNALWINKHFGSTWNSGTKFQFNWRSTLDANGPTAEALEYDFFLFRSGTEFMFGSQCHQTGSAKWQVWDQLHVAWVDTTLPCNLPALVAHDLQWTGHISGSNMVYDTLTIDGVANAINMTEPSGPTAFADGTGIHFQLDIGPGGQPLSETLDNINFLVLAADGSSPALLPLSGAGVSPPPPPPSQASGVLGKFGMIGTSGVQ